MMKAKDTSIRLLFPLNKRMEKQLVPIEASESQRCLDQALRYRPPE